MLGVSFKSILMQIWCKYRPDLHELLRTDSNCCAMIVAQHSAEPSAAFDWVVKFAADHSEVRGGTDVGKLWTRFVEPLNVELR